MEIDKKMIGLADIAVMLLSLVWMVSWGIGSNEKLIPLAVFSATLSIAVVFFPGWFGSKE